MNALTNTEHSLHKNDCTQNCLNLAVALSVYEKYLSENSYLFRYQNHIIAIFMVAIPILGVIVLGNMKPSILSVISAMFYAVASANKSEKLWESFKHKHRDVACVISPELKRKK
ncbi:hypothetical protein K9M47_03035 [Candidatus Gracilibacteria bacterium]|nr:hypothetical protein [Candidatus Gracilibacteria bacterium]